MKKQAVAVAPLAPKTDPVPPPTGWALVWKHLQNWQSIYLFLPVSLISIWLFAKMAYFLTGRQPQENADWIVGMAGNLVKLVFLIVFVELLRQQTGIWFTREQLLENPKLAWIQAFSKAVALCAGVYILSH